MRKQQRKTSVEDVKFEDVDNVNVSVIAGYLEVAGFENDELEILLSCLCID